MTRSVAVTVCLTTTTVFYIELLVFKRFIFHLYMRDFAGKMMMLIMTTMMMMMMIYILNMRAFAGKIMMMMKIILKYPTKEVSHFII